MTTFLSRSRIRMPRVLTMLLGCWLFATGVSETAEGAPASFGYQATVLRIQGDLPESSGLSVNPGDDLTGSFTFEPAMLPPLSNPLEQQDYFNVQPYTVEVTIDGNTFGTSAARPGVEYGASKNVVVLDDPLGMLDELEVSSSLVSSDLTQYSETSPGRSSLQMRFSTSHLTLESAGLPANVQVWNEFNHSRFLDVSLENDMGESFSFSAIIGPLTLVPEPSSITMWFVATLGLGLHRRRLNGS